MNSKGLDKNLHGSWFGSYNFNLSKLQAPWSDFLRTRKRRRKRIRRRIGENTNQNDTGQVYRRGPGEPPQSEESSMKAPQSEKRSVRAPKFEERSRRAPQSKERSMRAPPLFRGEIHKSPPSSRRGP